MPTVKSNGVELNYLREGRGAPVLLVHGYLFGADFWRPQMDALKDRFEVIAPDLRGQMGSQTTDEDAGYDLWNQAEDMHGLITALGIAPVHYVGLSMGGFIGMRLALRHPADVRSLVLMDTTAEPEEEEKLERYEAMRSIVEAGDLERVAPALPNVFFVDDFIADHPEQVEAWLDRLRAANPMGFVRAGRMLDAREDISHRLGEIAVPTLVIHGTEDVAIPMERAERLAAGIPGARLETIRAGHQSNVDRPEETSSLIREFLEAVSGAE
jgi:3-oxoadipate enol-lactonase